MQPQKTLQWHIQQDSESLVVRLSGELTRNTLLPLWKQRASFLSPTATQSLIWDLKSLESLDSAGFTLLSELLNFYQTKTASSTILNAPMILINLADLFGLTEWLASFLPQKTE